jgi:acetyl-CoA carboxylase biotin carboxyl carrier protein
VARGRSDKRNRKSPGGAARAAKPAAKLARPRKSAFPEIEQLVELMDRHGLIEVDFESGKDGSRRFRVSRAAVAPPVALHSAHASAPASGGHAGSAARPAGEPAAPPAPAAETLHVFKSPMVGTFYRAPSPEAPPFTSVGDKVDEHTTVCIIEAMKVMNEITPDKSGEIVSIEVENGEAVEYGQPLFLIRPK